MTNKKALLIFFLSLVLIAPPVLYFYKTFFKGTDLPFISKFKKANLNDPCIRLLDTFNEQNHPGKVLTFDQALFAYYANMDFIANINPNILNLYEEKSINTLFEKMRALNISHIYIPNYFEPTYYNSIFYDFTLDNKHSYLSHFVDGCRIYKRVEKPGSITTRSLGLKKHDDNNYSANLSGSRVTYTLKISANGTGKLEAKLGEISLCQLAYVGQSRQYSCQFLSNLTGEQHIFINTTGNITVDLVELEQNVPKFN